MHCCFCGDKLFNGIPVDNWILVHCCFCGVKLFNGIPVDNWILVHCCFCGVKLFNASNMGYQIYLKIEVYVDLDMLNMFISYSC